MAAAGDEDFVESAGTEGTAVEGTAVEGTAVECAAVEVLAVEEVDLPTGFERGNFEVALAEAHCELGTIARESARWIADTCGGLEHELNGEAIGRAAAEAGTPVEPILAELRRRLPPSAAADLHRGATSQDAMDTAAMLVVAGRDRS